MVKKDPHPAVTAISTKQKVALRRRSIQRILCAHVFKDASQETGGLREYMQHQTWKAISHLYKHIHKCTSTHLSDHKNCSISQFNVPKTNNSIQTNYCVK